MDPKPDTPCATELLPATQRRPKTKLKSKGTIATGVVLLAFCIYVVARTLEPRVPWVGAVRAFAEASVVGGLADWFAVVALFRHPLGLRWIPHTAILPRTKDRIGAGLADFIQEHFLTPETIVEKLRTKNIADGIAQWLTESNNAERVVATLGEILSRVVEATNDEDIRRFIRENLSGRLKEIRIGPQAAALLKTFVDEGRHQQVLTQLLLSGGGLVRKNERFIRDKVRQRVHLPNIFGLPDFVAHQIANGIVDGAIHTLDEASKDTNHPLRHQFNEAVAQFIRDLETSDKYSHVIEEMRQKFITSTGVSDFVSSVWYNFKSEMLAGFADPDLELRRRLVQMVDSVGLALQKDDAFRHKLDKLIIFEASSLAHKHRHEIGAIIRARFKKWDPTEAAEMLEGRIGEDLQYIRINGALVGGGVGLVLYFLSRFILP
jgi:uncharacterized membrane-anchored protein YjiN (DUF445 family)